MRSQGLRAGSRAPTCYATVGQDSLYSVTLWPPCILLDGNRGKVPALKILVIFQNKYFQSLFRQDLKHFVNNTDKKE